MTEYKEKAKIGTLSLVRNHRKGKDGKEYDLLIVEVLDPTTGNKIKLTGIIGYETSKYPHIEKDRTTGEEKKFPKCYTKLQFDGIKFADKDKYDYKFVPVAVMEDTVKAAPAPKKAVLTLPQTDDDNPF